MFLLIILLNYSFLFLFFLHNKLFKWLPPLWVFFLDIVVTHATTSCNIQDYRAWGKTCIHETHVSIWAYMDFLMVHEDHISTTKQLNFFCKARGICCWGNRKISEGKRERDNRISKEMSLFFSYWRPKQRDVTFRKEKKTKKNAKYYL